MKFRLSILVLVIFFFLNGYAIKPEVFFNIGHSEFPDGASLSKDGKFALTCVKNDPEIKLWDLQHGKNIKSYSGHTAGVNGVCFMPDGTSFVSCSNDSTIRLWNLSSGKEIWRVTENANIGAMSSDGKYLLLYESWGIIKIFDITQKKTIQTYNQFKNGLNAKMSFNSSSNEFFVFASTEYSFVKAYKYEISQCKIGSAEILHNYKGQAYGELSSISADGKYFITKVMGMNLTDSINVYEVATDKLILSKTGKIAMFSADHSSVILLSDRFPDYKTRLSTYNLSTTALSSEVILSSGYNSLKNMDIHIPSSDGLFGLFGVFNYTNLKTGEIQCELNGNIDVYTSVKSYFPFNTAFCASYSDNLTIWNLNEGINRFITGKDFTYFTPTFDEKYVYKQTDGAPFKRDLYIYKTVNKSKYSKGEYVKYEISTNKPVSKFRFNKPYRIDRISPNGQMMIFRGSASECAFFSLIDKNWKKEFSDLKTSKFSPSGNYLNLNNILGISNLWNLNTGTQESFGLSPTLGYKIFSANDQYAIGDNFIDSCFLVNTVTKDKKLLEKQLDIQAISNDGSKALIYILGNLRSNYLNRDNYLVLYDLNSAKKSFTLDTLLKSDELDNKIGFTPDNKYAYFYDIESQKIQFWNVITGKLLRSINIPFERFKEVPFEFVPQTGRLMFVFRNIIYLYNIETADYVALISHKNHEDWLAYTSDGYWDASPRGGEMACMVSGLETWNIDQFAVNTNRPDIILERLGSGNTQMIEHFRALYNKRLKKAGLEKALANIDIHLPKAEILKIKQEQKKCSIDIKLSDVKYPVKRYHIYINDIPIFGSFGKNVTILSFNESFELSEGKNKIEVSCVNEKGAESFRALTYANYAETAKKDLYILAFGVSKYQNSEYNLQFADKDAIDLSKTIESLKGKGFDSIYTKVLTNEQVTPSAIKASKAFTKNAKPDDTFILFIAGHGMHDQDAEATYYYLTANADVNNLKNTAANFETIEDLLQGIPPRNKLFLIDACESGEIDEEDQGQMLATATGSGIASRGFKSTSSQTTNNMQLTTKRSYLYQKDRYIYNDLARRSGAIVFSSSKGGELSYERSDIENGLFTENIIKALTTTGADKDKNGIVSTDELREFVTTQVSIASGNMQHPTVDRDNIYQKFGFGIK